MALPVFYVGKTELIEFYEKLLTQLYSLETMGKHNISKGCTRNMLYKLPQI